MPGAIFAHHRLADRLLPKAESAAKRIDKELILKALGEETS